jgi:hypothetical protein
VTAARYSCPLPTCGWALTDPPDTDDVTIRPVTEGRTLPAAVSIVGHTPSRSVQELEAEITAHLGTHDVDDWARALIMARDERDQYAAAARHLARRIREVAHAWITTLPETIRTAAVVDVLLGIASHVPDRPYLRDDLWQRIVDAYEARFESTGHPEDARHAADEAMSVVQPVIAELRAELEKAQMWGVHWKRRTIAVGARLNRALGVHEPVMDSGGLAIGRCTCGEPNPCPTRRAAGPNRTSWEECNCAPDCPTRIGTDPVPDPVGQAEERLNSVRALHRPVAGRTGWGADDDDTPGSYGDVSPACSECGSSEQAVRWPCPTLRALGPGCDGCGDTGACAGGPCAHPVVVAATGDEAWGSVWLHGDWKWLTQNMTTEQREHAADAVLRWMHGLDAIDGRPVREEPEDLRWWRNA